MFDHILLGAMQALGVDRNYIGNFSIWGITSDQGWNLILTEALSNGISFGIGAAAKGLGRFARWAGNRFGGVLAENFADLGALGAGLRRTGSSVLSRFGTTIDDLLDLGFSSTLKKISQMSSARELGSLLYRGVKEYFELVGEVIFEMAFDNVLRYDKSAQPIGGGEVFFTAMTLSIITSGLLRAMGRRGISLVTLEDGSTRIQASKARLILPSIALSLNMAMLVMRIPVMLGNMR
ncbi:MAG: hypothetical protein JW779_08340 [Candidatus Thorarchaeota archaeon]|nr:hypothetical protein [Candidatus Thorarchaeota archaeon]